MTTDTGAGAGSGTAASDPTPLDGTGTVTGQVIDGATRTPIGNVEVSLIVNGVKHTLQSSPSADPDLTGTFAFSGVPAGLHSLKIAAAGYAVWQTTVAVAQSQDATPHTENLGKIGLGKGFSLKVVTTADGEVLPGVTVVAQPNGVTTDCGFYATYYYYPPPQTAVLISPFALGNAEISVVTDSQGQGNFSGLNQCLQYLLVALPHDTNGDGVYDYTAAVTVYDGTTNSDDTIALALKAVQRNDPISLVGTSMDHNLRVVFTARNLSDTGPDPGSDLLIRGAGCVYNPNSSSCPTPSVYTPDYPSFSVPATGTHSVFTFVFNYPVSASSATVAYLDDLVNPDADENDAVDPGFPLSRSIAATVTLDVTGTIITVTPPAVGFPKNETITVGPITAVVNGVTSTLNQEVYVEDDTASGLSASTSITADNYRLLPATTTSYSSGAPSAYLDFPEYVTGTYRVVSYTTSSGTTTVNGPPVTIVSSNYYGGPTSSMGEMVFSDGSSAPACEKCGAGAGVVFRVPVTVTASSDYYSSLVSLADGDKLRVEVDVRDVVGHRLSKDVELVVQ
ncbi:MAG: carboxypeptidase regulatory-like domain-containing protein [Nitrospirae bacterium]|nr:carboxypeptidase regulatory-like domain-containing protein [Nitrospirota bacterium]